jgi:endonuclease-3
MTDQRAIEILRILKQTYGMPTWAKPAGDPFRTLIVTIISQNTNDKNTEKAFERLSNRFRIDPETLAHAQINEIEGSLKTAGLYRSKAKAIKQVSEIVVEKYRCNLNNILSKPLEDARQELMQLPHVGPKTADVVLLFAGDRPTVPVDTHVDRISKRLGFVSENSAYEKVRTALESLYPSRDYLAVHVLLISHGRKYCKTRSPHCGTCPLKSLCPSRNLFKRSS